MCIMFVFKINEKGGEYEMEFTQEQLKEMEELDKFYAQVREEEDEGE